VGASPDSLYSAPEAFEVAQAYVKAAKLEEGAPDPRTLVLDVALCDGLFKGVVKKGDTFPTTLPKVGACFRESMWTLAQQALLLRRGGWGPCVGRDGTQE
jgi:translation initiation factor 2D